MTIVPGGRGSDLRFTPNAMHSSNVGCLGFIFSLVSSHCDQAHGIVLRKSGEVYIVGDPSRRQAGQICTVQVTRHSPIVS